MCLRNLGRFIIPVLGIVVLTSCSSGSDNGTENTVFAIVTGFSQGADSTTVDIVDVGLPTLSNTTGSTVTLRSVSLVSVAPAVHLSSVTVYGPGPGVGLDDGDLLKYCRDVYPPYPLTRDVTAPHADSEWHVVLALRFTRPGQYRIDRVKIVYSANGHLGWQYQNLNTTMNITAAGPDTKSNFGGCP